METPAIQRLIDRAHAANNEPTRIDAKKAQVELDAMHARMAHALGDLFVYALQHGEPKAKEAAIKELLAADRERAASLVADVARRLDAAIGIRFPEAGKLLRHVAGGIRAGVAAPKSEGG